ncbi:Filamin-B [Varanus komodoensis]|nr:Filamin-B [Varanus komodoensis]
MTTQARSAARSDWSGGGNSSEQSRGSEPRWQQQPHPHPLGRSDLESDCAAMPVTEKDLAEDAPWKRIQQNTFTRWCNEHLRCVNKRIGNLQFDLSDGLRLIALLEVLSQKHMYRKYHQRPTFRQMQLENVSVALEFLEKENIKLVSIAGKPLASLEPRQEAPEMARQLRQDFLRMGPQDQTTLDIVLSFLRIALPHMRLGSCAVLFPFSGMLLPTPEYKFFGLGEHTVA